MKYMIGVELERRQTADLLVEVEAPDEATAQSKAIDAAWDAIARGGSPFRTRPEWYPDIDRYEVKGIAATRYDTQNYEADIVVKPDA